MPPSIDKLRIVEPEILDSLSPDDPAAQANRRDIRRLNHLMGNFRWFSRVLAKAGSPHGILELAGGDGSMGRNLLERGTVPLSEAYFSLDLAPRPAEWPANWDWKQQDIREFPFDTPHRTLLANLILHQFHDGELQQIGERIRQSGLRQLFVSEPSRSSLSLRLVFLLRLLGMNPVTVHDARVSIRAGFLPGEIHPLLGLRPEKWHITYTRCRGGVRMKAVRR